MTDGWKLGVTDSQELLRKEDLVQVLNNPDEIYEFARQGFGMVWYLAMQMSNYNRETALMWVEEALENHIRGESLSPGMDGKLNPYFEDKPADADY